MQSEHVLRTELVKRVHLPYLLSRPAAYRQDRPWPLVLFLHGSGERGSDLDRLKERGLPKIAQSNDLPFVLASPQCPEGQIWSQNLDALFALVEHLLATHAVDRRKVYLTGMSMGGTGTWHMATAFPSLFAAIAPVCGDRVWYIGDPAQVCVLRDVPVWAFHGVDDDVVPASASAELVHALRACGGQARLSLYEDVGHDVWNRAYADPELFRWLLAKTAPEPPTPARVAP